jgi:outer membrane protein assembly factor BamE
MPLFTIFRATLVAASCISLAACSSFNQASGSLAGLISPFKVDVVQGNFVSKEQKEAVQVGMTRAQVRDILGSPLVSSAFHADRWDYAFTLRRQGQEPQQRKLTVFFKGDELAKIEGDDLISEQAFVSSLSKGRSLGPVSVLELPANALPAVSTPAPANSATSSLASQPVRVYPPLETATRP